MGFLFVAPSMRDTRGVMRPVDGLAMDSLQGMRRTVNTGILALDSLAFTGKLGSTGNGGIARKEIRPASPEIPISNYNNGNTIGNFNRLNTGIHSRPGGLPPLSRASAPPGRASADPGGGTTAS
jgi:hypothetical protein